MIAAAQFLWLMLAAAAIGLVVGVVVNVSSHVVGAIVAALGRWREHRAEDRAAAEAAAEAECRQLAAELLYKIRHGRAINRDARDPQWWAAQGCPHTAALLRGEPEAPPTGPAGASAAIHASFCDCSSCGGHAAEHDEEGDTMTVHRVPLIRWCWCVVEEPAHPFLRESEGGYCLEHRVGWSVRPFDDPFSGPLWAVLDPAGRRVTADESHSAALTFAHVLAHDAMRRARQARGARPAWSGGSNGRRAAEGRSGPGSGTQA